MKDNFPEKKKNKKDYLKSEKSLAAIMTVQFHWVGSEMNFACFAE